MWDDIDDCYVVGAYKILRRHFPQMIEHLLRVPARPGVGKREAENWSNLGYAYAISGNRAEAQKVLDQMKAMSVQNFVAA